MTDLRVERARGHRALATGLGPAAAAPCGPLACDPHSRGGPDSTRGFRRRAEQDVSSLGPYLVKVFRDSVIRLRGGGGPGSVPGDRAAAAAFLKSASRSPTPGFPLPSQEGPQGWREPGVLSTSIPGRRRGRRRAETRPALWERLVAQGAAKIMSLFPSTPLLTSSPGGVARGRSVPEIEGTPRNGG